MKQKRHRLKNCPFCGQKNVKGFLWLNEEHEYGFPHIKCLSCYANGPTGSSVKDAVRLWNKRAD